MFPSLLVVSIFVRIVQMKQALRIDTTFGDNLVNEPDNSGLGRNFIFPGTKWCGPGNNTNGYDDLGRDPEVDKCCRDHDHCDNIAAGDEKHGLKNKKLVTQLNCRCDYDFKQCLRSANTRRGNFIGKIYFMIQDQCYKEQNPVIECEAYRKKLTRRRCSRYVVDSSKPKEWQWFDLPFYSDNDTDSENFSDDPEFDDQNNLLEIVSENFV